MRRFSQIATVQSLKLPNYIHSEAYSEPSQTSMQLLAKVVKSRGVFRAQKNIKDEAFCKKS